uniref:Ig-like domain-containing protein n=1 Tax=Pygocentrus nattereri TaxID=42514 RepID=A0AAR2KNP8_PYGNA
HDANSVIVVFYFLVVTKAAEIQSLRQTISAELGASVSLQCSAPEKMSLVYWYKQSVGKKPQLLVTVPKYGSVEFYGEFKDNPRFMVARNSGIASLSISNTIPSDTAVYYCAEFNAGIMSFGEGILLILQDAEYGHHTILQKPMSYQGRQGDSVNFQCTIHTNVSHGDHRVYWFRHGSGESHPGIIYTHGNRSDECEKSSETDSPTQSCVYKLPKRNLSLSDAGTYYCAVAACGQILFGNGSNLKVEGITWLIS